MNPLALLLFFDWRAVAAAVNTLQDFTRARRDLCRLANGSAQGPRPGRVHRPPAAGGSGKRHLPPPYKFSWDDWPESTPCGDRTEAISQTCQHRGREGLK